MSTEPNTDYPNPERLARLMRAFDEAMQGQRWAHLMAENLKRSSQKQLEAMADPSKLFLPHQSRARRKLTPLYAYRYIRDTIRLRRYNESWLKSNIR